MRTGQGRLRQAGGEILRQHLLVVVTALGAAGGVMLGQMAELPLKDPRRPVGLGCALALAGEAVPEGVRACPARPSSGHAKAEAARVARGPGGEFAALGAPAPPSGKAPAAAPGPMLLPLVLTRAEPLAAPALPEAAPGAALRWAALPPQPSLGLDAAIVEVLAGVLAKDEGAVDAPAESVRAVPVPRGLRPLARGEVANEPAREEAVPAPSCPACVQVGMFAERANAEQAVAMLRRMGFRVGVRDEDSLFAIAAGPLRSPAEVQGALAAAKAVGFEDAFVTR